MKWLIKKIRVSRIRRLHMLQWKEYIESLRGIGVSKVKS